MAGAFHTGCSQIKAFVEENCTKIIRFTSKRALP